MGSSPLLKNGPQLVFGPLELARQRRALERKSDRAGAREGEDPGLKVERVAFFFAFADLSAIAILAQLPAANASAIAPFPQVNAKSTPGWDRIGRGQMGNRPILSILSYLPDRDLANDKALAHLDQVAVGQEILAARLAQEIDVEAGGHR
jgi:hypothetical protein